MANKVIEIEIKINSNVDDATKDINNLSNSLEQASDSTKELKESQNQLGSSMKSSGKSILDNGGAIGILNEVTGGLASTVKDAIEALDIFKVSNEANVAVTEASAAATTTNTVATGELTIAQKALNLVLKANPYILIATLIAAITAALYSWYSASQKQKQILEEANNAINLNRISTDNLKKSIEDTATQTELSNNVEIARARALGVSEKEIQKLIQAQKELASQTAIDNSAKAFQQLIESQNTLANLRRKIGGGSAFFGGLTDEEEKTIKDAQDTIAANTEFYNKQQELVDKAIVDAQVNRFNTTAENNAKLQAENDKANGIAIQKKKDRIAEEKRLDEEEYNRKQAALKKSNDAEKAILDEIDKAEEKNAADSMTKKEAELAAENKRFEDLKAQAIKFGKDTEALTIDHLNRVNDINLNAQKIDYDSKKQNADAKTAIDEAAKKAQEQFLSAGADSLSQAAELLGESTDAGKAAAIAATTIDTYQSATASYNSLAGIPVVGPALGIAAAAIAVGAGLANVKKIIAVKTPNGGGGGSVPTAGSQPLTPQVNLFGSNNNQNTTAAKTTEVNPSGEIVVKAYVSETEISNTQAFVSKANESAKL